MSQDSLIGEGSLLDPTWLLTCSSVPQVGNTCPIHLGESKKVPPGLRDNGNNVQLSASALSLQPQGKAHLSPQQFCQH